jgi:dihydroxyacetone kinase
MSSKHVFDDLDGLVLKSLKGAIAANPTVELISDQRVIYDPTHNKDHVSLIGGGGSGHEPGKALSFGEWSLISPC